jgi:superoxide reductase
MADLMGVYKCEKCGNIVTVLHSGPGKLVCCGEEMKKIEANTVDAAQEKHVPVIEKTDDGILVKVGSAAHPMEEKHYIEWVQLVVDGVCMSAFLKPGDTPEKLFKTSGENLQAMAYCNLHGLWKSA